MFYLTLLLTLPQTKGPYVYGRNLGQRHGGYSGRGRGPQRGQGPCFRPAHHAAPPDGSVVAAIFDGAPATAAPRPRRPTAEHHPGGRLYPPDEAVPGHYRPVEDESLPAPTATDSMAVTVLHAGADTLPLRFWSIDDPGLLATVEAELFVNGEKTDAQQLTTGFRAVATTKTGACASTARCSGCAATPSAPPTSGRPSALRQSGCTMRTPPSSASNANHIRFMHVAGSPADVRAF